MPQLWSGDRQDQFGRRDQRARLSRLRRRHHRQVRVDIAPVGIYAGISVFAGSDGVTVNAPGGTVALHELSINGQGGRCGVLLQSAARLRVESCVVSNMQQDGVHDVGSGSELIVLDTIVRDNGNFGFNAIADASVVLDHVRVEHNPGERLRHRAGERYGVRDDQRQRVRAQPRQQQQREQQFSGTLLPRR